MYAAFVPFQRLVSFWCIQRWDCDLISGYVVLQGQFSLYFFLKFPGPVAGRIEQDFDRLLNGREVHRPSLDIPGVVNPAQRKTKVSYRMCTSRTQPPVSSNNNFNNNLGEFC